MILDKDIEKVFYTQEDIEKQCKRVGEEISRDYKNRKPLLVGILKGALPFMKTLSNYIDLYCTYDYMICSSYQGTTQSTGVVNIIKDLERDVKGIDVILVEDIVDSGLTIHIVKEMLLHRGARSVEIAALLDKKAGRKYDVTCKYNAFDVQNQFVVGFGLDYQEYYRNLPYVGILKKEIYSKKI